MRSARRTTGDPARGAFVEPIKIGWLGSALDGPDGGYDRIHRLAFDEAAEQGLEGWVPHRQDPPPVDEDQGKGGLLED